MQLDFRASPGTAPVLLSSPHSGRLYPERLLEQTALGLEQLRPLDDGPVDLLLEPARPATGGLLAASLPRAWIDLNRAPAELDAGLVAGQLPWRLQRSAKVRAGLGLIPTKVGERDVYRQPLPAAEIVQRLATVHAPFHEALRRRLEALRQRHGVAVLLDCHSMPKASVLQLGAKADIVVGDRHGIAALPAVTAALVREFRERGFEVAVNRPFAGGYITEACGRPGEGLHALQVEIRRDLFLDERSYRLQQGAGPLGQALAAVIRAFGAEVLRRVGRPVAA